MTLDVMGVHVATRILDCRYEGVSFAGRNRHDDVRTRSTGA